MRMSDQKFLAAAPERPRKGVWLTAEELRLVNAIRADKGFGPVLVMLTSAQRAPNEVNAGR
jgi:hypothetical protein